MGRQENQITLIRESKNDLINFLFQINKREGLNIHMTQY